jgi:hypothetical protein
MVNRDVTSGPGGLNMDRPSQQVSMLNSFFATDVEAKKPGCFLGRFFHSSLILATWQASLRVLHSPILD